MRVLVTGLGDIAHKGYLPVLAANPELELHLATRDQRVLREAGRSFRVPHLHASVEHALAAATFDAAFIHAATGAHPALVRLLLERRIPTFVDKPLADNLAETQQLVALAERQKTLLTVGFNRRFAPGYAALRGTGPSLIVMEKHRHRQADTPRKVVFDDFIHVIDTLLFLAPAPVERRTIETHVEHGVLKAVTLMLAGDGFTAIGTMHRDSGLDEERLDVIGNGVRQSVRNMSELVRSAGTECHHRRGDWTSVGRQRGFEAMCADFLAAVRAGRTTPAADILATHALCEAITAHANAQASLDRPSYTNISAN
ncbi:MULTISPECIES: Gfo/Idh/MocA family oxidoreductase [unclassified Sphingomonas]|uniref:Gfo/Idh/MocA family protein n=1 Tax=unclassified Sphingomonas TaxID=196159 RepID=UPI000E7412AC|nr:MULTISPECIES: Gfo/Idh/MocA family oxidoreductase [unclassified Sphingomonas]RKE45925.1 virulence factor [Sphingomonas sp. PP-CC-1A-547]TCM06874.1 virulence factor [Sphingomonas sp. PP-CC-3G-468]